MKQEIGIVAIVAGLICIILSVGQSAVSSVKEIFGGGGPTLHGSAILGGADASTKIFIAGKASLGISSPMIAKIILIVVGIGLIVIGIILALKNKKQ